MVLSIFSRVILQTLFTIILFSQFAGAAVWPTKNNWNKTWEDRYSNWVLQQWSRDTLSSENSPYGPLRVDCADAVYAMRIIFSYENGLPFAMKDPTGGSKPITNEMSRFDKLQDSSTRVKEFLKFIFETASTRSLPNDTYPVAMNRESVRSGGLILEYEKKHSFTIKRIDPTGQPLLYYSTTRNPGALLVRNSWPSIDWIFPGDVAAPAGIRWFRQPQYLNVSEWEVPGASDEQYRLRKSDWRETVTKMLATSNESREEQLERLFGDICEMAKFRVVIVNEALKLSSRIGERCMNRSEFDDLSTPSRDRQLLDAYKDLEISYRKAISQFKAGDLANNKKSIFDQVGGVTEVIKALFDRQDQSSESIVLNACPIAYRKQNPISLRELRKRMLATGLSSNPNDDVEQRWGESSVPSDKARRCPVY